jgi:hypothetical protein
LQCLPRMASHSHAGEPIARAVRSDARGCEPIRDTGVISLADGQ